MFRTLKRIIDWCGEFKRKLYIGFVFSFFSHLFAAMPVMAAAYTVGLFIDSQKQGTAFDKRWAGFSFLASAGLVILRFFFDDPSRNFRQSRLTITVRI